MPLFIAAAIVFGLSPLGRVLKVASLAAGRVRKVLDAYDLKRLHEEQLLDLNSAKERWRGETNNPTFPLMRYRVEAVYHESQGWAVGEMLLHIDEWVMLQQYMQLDAHNRTHGPTERIPCGIDGPRIAHVGRQRTLVPRLRDIAAKNAMLPIARSVH